MGGWAEHALPAARAVARCARAFFAMPANNTENADDLRQVRQIGHYARPADGAETAAGRLRGAARNL